MAPKNKKAYYLKNREEILRKKRKYYQKNKTTLKDKIRLYGKKWYENNKEKIRKLHKEYYWKNKEKESQRHKILYLKNKDKILKNSREYYWKNRETVCLRHKKSALSEYKGEWQRIRRTTNPRWRLDENMGRAVWASLKDKKAGREWEYFVDYDLDQLIKHLEKKFGRKMNWNNYGKYWAVDHIKPKSLFVYNSENDIEFKKCWDLENLQPLEKIQNIKKGNRYIG